MQVWIKICGITTPHDGLLVAESGADAIGLNFVPTSRRCISVAQAETICTALARLQQPLTLVGLFADQDAAEVSAVHARLPLDLLQFHGRESGGYCESFGVPYLKAVAMDHAVNWDALVQSYASVQAFLLDSSRSGHFGGSGETFDWSCWPGEIGRPLILAGGLDPGNVGRAVRNLRPWGVDVSSGVEAGAPGVKDPDKISRFIDEVRRWQ